MTRAERAIPAAIAAALAGLLSCADAGAAGPPAAIPSPTATAVAATWTKRTLTLAYQGMTTKYSCEGFKHKMESLLTYFGARPKSIRLRAYGCAGGPYRASPAVNLSMEFETLVPSPSGGATTAVRGAWIERDIFGRTRISDDATRRRIERGDCELVQKFVATVLPLFTHEILQNLTRCIPHELDGTLPNLRVRVLAPEKDQNQKW